MQDQHTNGIETKRGAAMLLLIIFVIVLSSTMVLGTVGPLLKEMESVKAFVKGTNSYYHAEAGIEDVQHRIMNGLIVPSSGDIVIDGSTTTVSVVLNGATYEINAESTVDDNFRKVYAELSNSITEVNFNYAAQADQGGIIMDNNTDIREIGGGDTQVYAAGPIVMTNNSYITGDVIVGSGLTEDSVHRSSACDTDTVVGKVNPDVDPAQSFVASTTEELGRVSLYIKKQGNPLSRTVHIVADNGNKPDVTSLASGDLNTDLVGASYAWVDVSFTSPATLTAGQTYWIVLDSARNNNKHWYWCTDSAGGYASGTAMMSEDWDTDPWANVTGDFTFRLFWGEDTSKITGAANTSVSGIVKADTITDMQIGGDAYYQIISGSSVGGASHPGSAAPPLIESPLTDAVIQQWRDNGTIGGVIAGDCPGTAGCSPSMGPIQINGNFNVPANETWEVTGTVYVTGNLTIENGAILKCDAAYANTTCVIVVDGYIDIWNNADLQGSGFADGFILVVSTVENCLGGVQTPSCAGNNSAADLQNNMEGAIVYASKSQIYMHNNVELVSIYGYRLHMYNNAVLEYDPNAATAEVASGPAGGWQVNTWKEVQ